MGVNNMNGVFYATTYHPIQAGSIDGTDITAHDNGVYRALLASSAGLYDPLGDPKAQGDPYCSLFVGRLAAQTDEKSLREVVLNMQAMTRYGQVKNLRLVRHIVTGASCGYAFVEFEAEDEMHQAYEGAHLSNLDGSTIIVDYNRQQLMPEWIPRRLGGGLGGNKESGQLRFGGRDRPFRAPLRPIPHEELQKLGIPLPPEGHYMTRFQVPPPPQRKYGTLADYEGRNNKKNHGAYSVDEGNTFPREGVSSKSHGRESIDLESREGRDIDGHRWRRGQEGPWDRGNRNRDSGEEEGRGSKRRWEGDSPKRERDTIKESRYEGFEFERVRSEPRIRRNEADDGDSSYSRKRYQHKRREEIAHYEDEEKFENQHERQRQGQEGREHSREESNQEYDSKYDERTKQKREEHRKSGVSQRSEPEGADNKRHHKRQSDDSRERSDHKHKAKEGDWKHYRHDSRHWQREGEQEAAKGNDGKAHRSHRKHKKHRERSEEDTIKGNEHGLKR